MSDAWLDTVARRLGPPIFTTTDEVRFNCWRYDCGSGQDNAYHMYLNTVKGKFFCQRCQRGGTLEYLAKALGLQTPEKSLTMWDRIITEFLYGKKNGEVEYESQYVPWPKEYEEMIPGTQAYRYLHERGISDKKIEKYQIGFGTGKLRNRIIFPDFNKDGDLCYWVARSYGNHHAKYKNATAKRERQVFNLGLLETREARTRVVICEGPISAIISGYDAVATYGKYVTGFQIDRLVRFGAEEYVIAIDGDALTSAVSLATRLWRRRLNVKFVRFSYDEDPASVGGLEMRRRIRTAMKWTDLSVLEVLV